MSGIKKTVISCIFATISVFALVTAFGSVLEFTVFLSQPNFYKNTKVAQNSDRELLNIYYYFSR